MEMTRPANSSVVCSCLEHMCFLSHPPSSLSASFVLFRFLLFSSSFLTCYFFFFFFFLSVLSFFLFVLSSSCSSLCGLQAPRPSTGPHKRRECLPLVVFVRNRLKYALTYHEVKMILKERQVLVDNKVRTDVTYPTGFMGMYLFFSMKQRRRKEKGSKGCYAL